MRDWRHSWAGQAQRMGNLLIARRWINRPYHQRARMGQREWNYWIVRNSWGTWYCTMIGPGVRLEHARRSTQRLDVDLGVFPALTQIWAFLICTIKKIISPRLPPTFLSTMNIVFFVLHSRAFSTAPWPTTEISWSISPVAVVFRIPPVYDSNGSECTPQLIGPLA